jgi:hypothetical protein
MKLYFQSERERWYMKPTWIDVWYDRSQRMWAAQLKDDEGYLIGSAEWGTKGDIELTVKEWIRDFQLDEIHIKDMRKKWMKK